MKKFEIVALVEDKLGNKWKSYVEVESNNIYNAIVDGVAKLHNLETGLKCNLADVISATICE